MPYYSSLLLLAHHNFHSSKASTSQEWCLELSIFCETLDLCATQSHSKCTSNSSEQCEFDSQWVRSITPNSSHSGISIAEHVVRLHNSGIGMAKIQFCRFRARGRILRSPARISRRMWHVGTRAEKLMLEACGFPAHSYTKPSTSVRVQEHGARRSVDLLFL